jgi:hypothetical protein
MWEYSRSVWITFEIGYRLNFIKVQHNYLESNKKTGKFTFELSVSFPVLN